VHNVTARASDVAPVLALLAVVCLPVAIVVTQYVCRARESSAPPPACRPYVEAPVSISATCPDERHVPRVVPLGGGREALLCDCPGQPARVDLALCAGDGGRS